MKRLVVMLMTVLVTSCASYPQHWGDIPKDIEADYHPQSIENLDGLSEIICAEGEREYYFLGTSKPSLQITFDKSSNLFTKYYEAVKIYPHERSFTLKWSFSDKFAKFKVSKFKFEPDTRYYAKYSAKEDQIKVWIEKENGEVVYGKRPVEGQF